MFRGNPYAKTRASPCPAPCRCRSRGDGPSLRRSFSSSSCLILPFALGKSAQCVWFAPPKSAQGLGFVSDDQPCARGASECEAGGREHHQTKTGHEGFINRSLDLAFRLKIDLGRNFHRRQPDALILELPPDFRREIERRYAIDKMP